VYDRIAQKTTPVLTAARFTEVLPTRNVRGESFSPWKGQNVTIKMSAYRIRHVTLLVEVHNADDSNSLFGGEIDQRGKEAAHVGTHMTIDLAHSDIPAAAISPTATQSSAMPWASRCDPRPP
jgi:hypothetical protein